MSELGVFLLTAIVDPSAVHADAEHIQYRILLANTVQSMGYILMIVIMSSPPKNPGKEEKKI